jgi:hypothetical protein
MNGTKHNLAAIETLPQSVGTGPSSLGTSSVGGVMPPNCLLPKRGLSSTAGDSGSASCICRGDWPGPSAILHV